MQKADLGIVGANVLFPWRGCADVVNRYVIFERCKYFPNSDV
jgi:hypothetical protein